MKAASKREAFFSRFIATVRNGSSGAEELLRNTGADDIASAGEASADFLVAWTNLRPCSTIQTRD